MVLICGRLFRVLHRLNIDEWLVLLFFLPFCPVFSVLQWLFRVLALLLLSIIHVPIQQTVQNFVSHCVYDVIPEHVTMRSFGRFKKSIAFSKHCSTLCPSRYTTQHRKLYWAQVCFKSGAIAYSSIHSSFVQLIYPVPTCSYITSKLNIAWESPCAIAIFSIHQSNIWTSIFYAYVALFSSCLRWWWWW